MYTRNTEARSGNHRFRGKVISIKYFGCVSVSLAIQHAMVIRRIILSCVAFAALPHCSTLSDKRGHEFQGEKNIEHKMCVLILPTTFV